MGIVRRHPITVAHDLHVRRLLEPHRGWHYAQELREIFGEMFLIVSPGQIYLNCCNAEAIVQMTTRRNDFEKPIEVYGIVDIYGSSVLTTEGADWKRHRKIVAPAFSEKSNALVWKESLRQAKGMLKYWSTREGNVPGNIKVKDTAPGTALMTLHVISGAGFGVSQVWDGEGEDQLAMKAIPGFNTTKLSKNHTLAFKDALNTLLHGMIWVAIFPIWLLRK
jgi:cytochrome P450